MSRSELVGEITIVGHIHNAVHNARMGVPRNINGFNFQTISELLGVEIDHGIEFGPASLHPATYDPLSMSYSVGEHLAGLTSMVASSPNLTPVARTDVLVGAVNCLASPVIDKLLFGYPVYEDVSPKLISVRRARKIVRTEIQDTLERAAWNRVVASDIQQIRHRLDIEWGKATQLARAGVVAGGVYAVYRVLRNSHSR